MDVPDLVRQAVGDEDIRAGVNLGDEDAVVFTPTRALVYRGEGLLSDEDVSVYGFDFERLAVSEGRRKTKFTMTYVEGERAFTVPGKRTDDVLEMLIEGTLRVGEAIDADESVTGVFRFSEMTLVVTDGRMLKHIGEYTWDADYESFPYDDLTQVAFEEGSVATQVVLGVGNRSERIKAPNAEAGLVRKTLQQAIFSYHGVDSLEELNRKIAVEPEESAGATDATGGLGLDSGIDPLVSDDPEEESADADLRREQSGDEPEQSGQSSRQSSASSSAREASSNPDATSESASSRSRSPQSGSSGPARSSGNASADRSAGQPSGGPSSESSRQSAGDSSSTGQEDQRGTGSTTAPAAEASHSEDVLEQLSDLTRAVERQNELLHRQQKTVEKLIEELRQGR